MKPGEVFDREAILFDYMEGNLSAEQNAYVEALLIQDPGLKEELSLWQETVIKEELPPVLPLSKLYRPAFSWQAPIVSAVLLLIVSISSALIFAFSENDRKVSEAGQAKNRKEERREGTTLSGVASDSAAVIVTSKEEAPASPKVKPEVRSSKSIPLDRLFINEKETVEIFTKEEAPANTLAEVKVPDKVIIDSSFSQIVSGEPIDPNSFVADKNELPKRKMSKEEKKTLRKIARMKRKAQQLKEQQQFLKGNKPYVVPPDLKNF